MGKNEMQYFMLYHFLNHFPCFSRHANFNVFILALPVGNGGKKKVFQIQQPVLQESSLICNLAYLSF